jgi:hypothetical protein
VHARAARPGGRIPLRLGRLQRRPAVLRRGERTTAPGRAVLAPTTTRASSSPRASRLRRTSRRWSGGASTRSVARREAPATRRCSRSARTHGSSVSPAASALREVIEHRPQAGDVDRDARAIARWWIDHHGWAP